MSLIRKFVKYTFSFLRFLCEITTVKTRKFSLKISYFSIQRLSRDILFISQEKIDLIHDLTIRGELGRLKVMLDRKIWITGMYRNPLWSKKDTPVATT